MDRMRKRLAGLVTLVVSCILAAMPAMALNAGTKIFRTVESASEGCQLVALDGSFVSDSQGALDRINAIRYEACAEGIKDPRNTARLLSPADYVPIKWSSSLEYIARVRAAEASLVVSHTRPNGRSCFSVVAPDGVSSYGEVLAWSASDGILSGIDQWYAEKNAWVHNTGGVTGHYTQMIDPSNTYVGIGCFLYDGGVYYNTTSGEFSSASNLASEAIGAAPDCRAIIEIRKDALSDVQLFKTDEKLQEEGSLDKGDELSFALGMTSTLEGYRAYVLEAGNVRWSVDDPSIVQTDSFGNIRITGVGTVTLTATADSGMSASVALSPAHKIGDWSVESKATKDQDGRRVKKCSICGEITQEETITQLGEVSLSTGEFTYDGSSHKPSVLVRDITGASVAAGNYRVSYQNNKDAGYGTVNITFRKEYAGAETMSFLIRPKKVAGLKAKAGKKSMTLTWKKRAEQVSGYEIEYSLKKNFSNSKVITVKKNRIGSKTIRKLKAGKRYYVRIRAYKKTGGAKVVSLWSKAVRVKVKAK